MEGHTIAFALDSTPLISALSPAESTAAPAENARLTIGGEHLLAETSIEVRLNGIPCVYDASVHSNTNSLIECTIYAQTEFLP